MYFSQAAQQFIRLLLRKGNCKSAISRATSTNLHATRKRDRSDPPTDSDSMREPPMRRFYPRPETADPCRPSRLVIKGRSTVKLADDWEISCLAGKIHRCACVKDTVCVCFLPMSRVCLTRTSHSYGCFGILFDFFLLLSRHNNNVITM